MRAVRHLRHALAVLCLTASAASGAPHLVAGDTGFLCRHEQGRATGVMCELAVLIATRLDAEASIEIVPHARLKEMMKRATASTYYLPASGQDGGRHNLQTVLQLLDDDYVLVTLAGSGVDGSTLGAARRLRSVAVLRGSEGERIARQLGFANVEAKATQAICATMLSRGRVDAWISTWHGARYAARGAGMDDAGLTRGGKIGAAPLYVLTSAATPRSEIMAWRREYTLLRRNGTLAQIYGRYGMPLPD